MRPRAALALAGDRDHAGRSGTDLLAALVLLILATRLRVLVAAGWAGWALGAQYAIRLVVQMLTDTLTIDLGVLVIAAVVIWGTAGRRRQLGRAFDLACVAVLPLVIVDLVAGVTVHALALPVPTALVYTLTGVAYAWTGILVGLAMLEGMRPSPAPVRGVPAAGWVLVGVAAAGLAFQGLWIAGHVDELRPMTSGQPAPAFALPTIGPGGKLGPRVTIPHGKITVIDFWATWCNPCVKAMPHVDAFARAHPDVAVFAVAMDEPADARAFFDEKHFTPTLVLDDHDTSSRFGVTMIPHTVIVDRQGNVRQVASGGGLDLEAALRALQ